MNELQKAVLNISKIKHLLLHFCCLIARSYFHIVLLPLYLYCIVFLFYSFNPATWGHSPKDIEHVKNHVT